MSTARRDLARRQEELLAALVAGGPVPEGFDAERIRLQAGALIAKRRDGVARAAPRLPELLGGAWPEAFTAWARTHPKPAEGGSRADAAAFARHARAVGLLPYGEPKEPKEPAARAEPAGGTGIPPVPWWRRLVTLRQRS